MKIRHNLQLQLLATKEEPSKDGTKTYKRLAVMTMDNDAGMLNCSDEIYEMIQKQISSGKVVLPAPYNVVTVFDDKYDYYRIEVIAPVDSKK